MSTLFIKYKSPHNVYLCELLFTVNNKILFASSSILSNQLTFQI
jgi:hypothetical protein